MRRFTGITAFAIIAALTPLISAQEPIPAASDDAVLAVHLVSEGTDAPVTETRVEFVIPKGRTETEVVATGVTDDEGWAELKGKIGLDGFLRIYSDDRQRPLQTGRYKLTEEKTVVDPLEVPPPASALVRLDLSDTLREAAEQGIVTKFQVRIGSERGAPPPADKKVRAEGIMVDVPVSGEVLVEDLAPGRWSAMVMATIMNKIYVLNPGDDYLFDLFPLDRQQVTVPASVPLITGQVTWKDEPFVAHLNMRAAAGNESRTPTQAIVTDQTGFFAFPFPDTGEFHFLVAPLGARDSEEMFFTWLRDVHITPNRALEIVLPAGRIEGTVAAEDGKGVKGIRVTASYAGQEEWDASDQSWEDGRFALEGLKGGTLEVVASGPTGTSEPRQIVLAPDAEVDDLTLVLSIDKLTGRIIGPNPPDGPIWITSDTGERFFTAADPEGVFHYGSPDLKGRRLNVAMMGRERTQAWLASAIEDLQLQLPVAWGTAVFNGTFTRDDHVSKGLYLVNEEGGFIQPSFYARSSTQNSIPLSAGRWTLSKFEGPAVPGGTMIPLSSFVVPAGGVVNVEVPE